MARRTKYERSLLFQYGIAKRGEEVFLRGFRAMIDAVRDEPIVANDAVGDVLVRAAMEVRHLRSVLSGIGLYSGPTKAHARRELGLEPGGRGKRGRKRKP